MKTTNRWLALGWIGLSVLFALSLWYSASVIVEELTNVWNLNAFGKAWVSAAVPIGFVFGAFISAYFGVADRYNPRKLFAISALSGAILNGLLIFADNAFIGILLRFLTGMTLAGVYPVAVKMLAQWFPSKRGLAIGILIAALTLGTSLPHVLLLFFTDVNWIMVILTSSILAFVAAFIIHYLLIDAPVKSGKTHFSFQLVKKVIKNKPVMLANYGYFGHMWELYAMWTWLPAFLSASFIYVSPSINPWASPLAAFLSIGVAGAIGCILGGIIADKIGRAYLTIIAMGVSAACSIAIGFTFGHSIWLPVLLSIVWGVFVIADSAQFSAAVSEYAEIEYVGTALTFQMCIGFLITIFSINMIPLLLDIFSWKWIFSLLSIGPLLGIISMLSFRKYEKGV